MDDSDPTSSDTALPGRPNRQRCANAPLPNHHGQRTQRIARFYAFLAETAAAALRITSTTACGWESIET